MLTRIDIATFDPRYRQFRAELRYSTNVDPEAVARWLHRNRHEIAESFSALPEALHANLVDYAAYIRYQYARAMGLVS